MENFGPEKIVNVDMDGVLAYYEGYAVIDLPEEHRYVEMKSFYVIDNYPEEYHELIKARQNHPDFYKELPIMQGALQGLKRIVDAGYRPRILSAPPSNNPYAKDGKLHWISENLVPVLGQWVRDEAVIDRNKHAYDGLVLIDDRSEVVRPGEAATWEHVVFDSPHNQLSKAAFRLYGWNDPNLEAILDEAYKRRTSGVAH